MNAIIGDNGIITNAQTANMKQKVAELEEYIQEYYVTNYDSFEQYPSNIIAIKSLPYSKKWIYTGKLGYVLDNKSDVHYFLNFDGLNEEMKKIIGNNSAKDYTDYVECKDVWGITEDLKVYYYGNGIDDIYSVSNIVLGKENGADEVFASGSTLAKVIKGADSTENVTIEDLRTKTTLDLDQNSGIDNFNDFYNFTVLEKLTLSNMTLESLDGLEYATNLKDVFIQNTTIGDYSKLSKLKLRRLHIYKPVDEEVRKLFDNILGIGGKDIPTLKYLGLYGKQHFTTYVEVRPSVNTDTTYRSLLTNVSYLSNLSTKTKESVEYLYLNNNSITNIDNLYEFKNVHFLRLEANSITSLAGLYNKEESMGMVEIERLFARNNLLGKDLEGDLLNPTSDSLRSFSITTENEDETYSFTKTFTNIIYLDLANNTNLKFIDYMKPCTTLQRIWLEGCGSLQKSSVLAVADRLNSAVTEIDGDYTFYLASNDNTITSLDIGTREMTLTDFDNLLKGKQSMVHLKLDGISFVDSDGDAVSDYNTAVNTTLGKLTAMKYLSVKGLSNLSSLTFVSTMPDLRQLDLRGTAITDLSNIVQYTTKLQNLIIDNDDIVIPETKDEDGNIINAGIEELFNRCGANGGPRSDYSISNYFDSGMLLCTSNLIAQIADCTKITTVGRSMEDLDNSGFSASGIWDFRKCTDFRGTFVLNNRFKGSIYLPTGITELRIYNHGDNIRFLNISSLTSLTTIYCGNSGGMSNLMELFNGCSALSSIECYTYFPNLGELTYPTKYTSIALYGYLGTMGSNSLTDEKISAVGNFTNLTKFSIYYSSKITRIPESISNCSQLETINFQYTAISSLYPIRNLSNLSYLRVSDTPLLESGSYKLSNGETVNQNNMDIIAGLFAMNLRQIYLANTNVTDFSTISGLAWTDWSGFKKT